MSTIWTGGACATSRFNRTSAAALVPDRFNPFAISLCACHVAIITRAGLGVPLAEVDVANEHVTRGDLVFFAVRAAGQDFIPIAVNCPRAVARLGDAERVRGERRRGEREGDEEGGARHVAEVKWMPARRKYFSPGFRASPGWGGGSREVKLASQCPQCQSLDRVEVSRSEARRPVVALKDKPVGPGFTLSTPPRGLVIVVFYTKLLC